MTDLQDPRIAAPGNERPVLVDGPRATLGPPVDPSTLDDAIATSGLDVRPVAGRIGAEIHGIDLTQPISDREVDGVRAALLRHRVVFFREQFIDHAQQIAFGRRFGELTYAHPHDDTPPDGFPEIYTVDTRRFEEQYGYKPVFKQRFSYNSGWHSDVTPAINPPLASILRADVVPPQGGDTTFTSLVAAYEGLSEPVKQFIDGLWAEHFYGAGTQGFGLRNGAYSDRFEKRPLVSHHPVVRVHPETGEKALYVNPTFTSHILDVSPHESRWILDHLFHELSHPGYTVRFRWEPGSIAFWDNRTTAHLAPLDVAEDTERVLHRVTLIGDVPVGPDGRSSELVSGVAFQRAPLSDIQAN